VLSAIALDAERAAIVDAIGPEARLLAWGCVTPHGARNGPSDDSSLGLTQREREVAALFRAGMSNRQIATSLVISERTVEHHVSNILTRLGLRRVPSSRCGQ
jgi:DNA-binding NarL/FixJ family response regulator